MASIVGYKRRLFNEGSKGWRGQCFVPTCLARAEYAVIGESAGRGAAPTDRQARAYCAPHAAWYVMRHHITRMPLTLRNDMSGNSQRTSKKEVTSV